MTFYRHRTPVGELSAAATAETAKQHFHLKLVIIFLSGKCAPYRMSDKMLCRKFLSMDR